MMLIDSHTHFDDVVFDADRLSLAHQAVVEGVQGLMLVGYQACYFSRLLACQQQLNTWADEQQRHHPTVALESKRLSTWVAAGLHPAYIAHHTANDLMALEQLLKTKHCIAVGEIGLDTYLPALKEPSLYQKQKEYFQTQLALAQQYQLPVLLHVRRAHADVLAQLKIQRFNHGGIAHAFGGGIEEAKQYLKLGFKLGITGLICNPNAKKLRQTVIQVAQQFGLQAFVLETDCPDMLPITCYSAVLDTVGTLVYDETIPNTAQSQDLTVALKHRNVPHNLPYVLEGLHEVLTQANIFIDKAALATQIWHNTWQCLRLSDG